MKHSLSFSASTWTVYGVSIRSFAVMSAFALLGAGSVLAGDTAYDALRVACAKAGRDAQSRIVRISGTAGKPQPTVWRVVIEDAAGGAGRSGVQEIDVQRDKVVGLRKGGGVAPGLRVNLAAVQLDSDGVFTVANTEALRANVSFDRLDYVLSTGGPGGAPSWKVELFDGPVTRVGSLKIAADSGTILERSSELTITEEDRREARWSKPGQPYRSVPDFFHRAWKGTENTGYKLKNWATGYGWTPDREPAIPSN